MGHVATPMVSTLPIPMLDDGVIPKALLIKNMHSMSMSRFTKLTRPRFPPALVQHY